MENECSPCLDLHTNNLALTLPNLNREPEYEFIDILGKPDIEFVQRKDSTALGAWCARIYCQACLGSKTSFVFTIVESC